MICWREKPTRLLRLLQGHGRRYQTEFVKLLPQFLDPVDSVCASMFHGAGHTRLKSASEAQRRSATAQAFA